MSGLTKRIYTGFFLLIFFISSIFNKFILSVLLLLCFYQLFYEFFYIFKKIFENTKLKLFILSATTLLFLLLLITFVWIPFHNDNLTIQNTIIMIICITISTDIGGYVFGKIFKGKKLSKISPNKTYSGMIGSYIFSIILAITLFKNQYEINYLLFFIFFISTVSQIGDFSISYLKRLAKIKDTGNILPGHGGFLDRFDGLIFSLSFGLLVTNFL